MSESKNPKYVDHLVRQGYIQAPQTDIVTGREYWERQTRYATPRCKMNGIQRVRCYVDKRTTENGDPFQFEMEMAGFNGRFWSTITVTLDEDLLCKSSGEVEHRLADAWREMT